MPVYKDKRNRLYIEFQYKGHRHKERLPAGTSKADAARLESKIKNDLMFQSHGINTRRDITFEVFLAEYFGPFADTYSKAAFDRAVLLCKAAMPFLKGKPMRSIKAADIEKVKAARINEITQHGTKRKPATVEREMSILSRIFSIAVKNDLCEYNPCARVEKLRFDNVQDKVLRREHEQALFDNMHSEWAKDICLIVLHTGLRQNDVMSLTRFEVRLSDNCIVREQGKVKRKIEVRLNAVSREILERRLKQHPSGLLFPSPITGTAGGSVRHCLTRACKRAGIPAVTIRDLRRTFGTRLVEDGADAVTAARMLGHASLRMVSRYVRSSELTQDAADRLVKPVKLKVVK